MAGGKVGRGGKPEGAGKSGGAGQGGKTQGSNFGGKIDKSAASQDAKTTQTQAMSAASAAMLEVIRQARASGEGVTERVVSHILRQQLRISSKALAKQIAEALQQDPQQQQALERLTNAANSQR